MVHLSDPAFFASRQLTVDTAEQAIPDLDPVQFSVLSSRFSQILYFSKYPPPLSHKAVIIMGQMLSQDLNPENHEAMWITGHTICERTPPPFPFDAEGEFKPSAVRERDTNASSNGGDLWSRFGEDVDKHSSKINKYLAFINIVTIVVVVSFVIFVSSERGKTIVKSRLWNFLILGFIILSLSARFYILLNNQKLDAKIKEVCELHNFEFQSLYGLSMEYRTQYTGFCKPKGARPARAIVFIPIQSEEGDP